MARSVERYDGRVRRQRRVRKKVLGTPERPRLTVFRSAHHIYAQLIDDTAGVTLAAASTVEPTMRERDDVRGRNQAAARAVGLLIAERAKAKGLTAVVFDRNGYVYHGVVRAVAEGAREGELEL
ncbi:MAG TPA: 50S ribosomal protein L18 [Armatimonadetes bacterium]|nr:50S ribosomal protein L18 [Armatimonadota bacterium]